MTSVVVVTGASRGIGRAICVRFAADGARVVAAARSGDELHATQTAVKAVGGTCRAEIVDVSIPEEVEQLVESTLHHFGRIDVLVNNAGIAPLGNVTSLQTAAFRALMAVNVEAVYHGCRAVWPTMAAQRSGVIVNVSSIASVDPFPGFTAYGASKAWVNAWTKGLAEEGRACNIRVFAVAPGAVETRMLRDALPDFPADHALNPENIADVVHALTHDSFRYATGQTVFVRK